MGEFVNQNSSNIHIIIYYIHHNKRLYLHADDIRKIYINLYTPYNFGDFRLSRRRETDRQNPDVATDYIIYPLCILCSFYA